MEKKHQVFVSSTYQDLREERAKVFQTLVEVDCIPSGMELFPAVDEDQWEYIKSAIDECDYYILIIAGRYGSTDQDNISYTEKEFDYAVANKKPVLALVHESPDTLAVNLTDGDDESKVKLEAFRNKVMTGRLVKKWKAADELPGVVALGMIATKKRFPSVGWVRANNLPDEDLASESLALQRENKKLLEEVNSLRTSVDKFKYEENRLVSDRSQQKRLADFSEVVTIIGNAYGENIKFEATWRDLFIVTATQIERDGSENSVQSALTSFLNTLLEKPNQSVNISSSSLQKVLIQFRALGYIKLSNQASNSFYDEINYRLTEVGQNVMLSELAEKSRL